jgi:hypothetical protein
MAELVVKEAIDDEHRQIARDHGEERKAGEPGRAAAQ